jgi:hypothetical protein
MEVPGSLSLAFSAICAYQPWAAGRAVVRLRYDQDSRLFPFTRFIFVPTHISEGYGFRIFSRRSGNYAFQYELLAIDFGVNSQLVSLGDAEIDFITVAQQHAVPADVGNYKSDGFESIHTHATIQIRRNPIFNPRAPHCSRVEELLLSWHFRYLLIGRKKTIFLPYFDDSDEATGAGLDYPPRSTMTMAGALSIANRFMAWHPDYFVRVDGTNDLARAKQEGRIGIISGMQDTNHFRSVDDVEVFCGLGQRLAQLTYNTANQAGDGCGVRQDRGLSGFGAELVRRILRRE